MNPSYEWVRHIRETIAVRAGCTSFNERSFRRCDRTEETTRRLVPAGLSAGHPSYKRRKLMQLPPSLEQQLEQLGVVVREQDVVQQPKVIREYKFRMPNLDKNGEPDF